MSEYICCQQCVYLKEKEKEIPKDNPWIGTIDNDGKIKIKMIGEWEKKRSQYLGIIEGKGIFIESDELQEHRKIPDDGEVYMIVILKEDLRPLTD